MKKIFLFILGFMMITDSFAQTYKIDTSEISFQNKLRPCFKVNFDADAKTVKKAWSSFLKKNYKIKTKGIGLLSDNDLISGEDVTINSVSDKRMNIYANITNQPQGSEMKYFMSFGYDFYIGPKDYPESFAGMKKLLNDFCVKFLNDYYNDQTSDILKEIKSSEKNIKKDNDAIQKNLRKSASVSAAEASALEAKNNAYKNDISQLQDKIKDFQDKLEQIKVKQTEITRN
jgi:hypothetical protein